MEVCPNGTYTPTVGNKEEFDCIPCPYGHSCTSGEIKQCPPGFYMDDPGQSECRPCAKGSYTYDYGLTEACPLCPTGYFCIQGLEPETCPEDSTSVQGADSADACYCMPGAACPPNIPVCPPKTELKPGGTSLQDCICKKGYECDYTFIGDIKINIVDKLDYQDPVRVHHAIQQKIRQKKSNIRLLVVPNDDKEDLNETLNIRSYM